MPQNVDVPGFSSEVVQGYSRIAALYDSDGNRRSFWSHLGEEAVKSIPAGPYRTIVDVGCGTGTLLLRLAERFPCRLVGVEPSAGMRERAIQATRNMPGVEVLEGSFERLPLATGSVDYLFSMWAFHWTTDLERSVAEIERVLAPDGQVDLFFVGAATGRDFEQALRPVYKRFMGLEERVASAGRTKRLDRRTVERVFSRWNASIDESYRTFYDSVDGHLAWRVRLEGHFSAIPSEQRPEFDRKVRAAMAALATDGAVPYTLHAFHVRNQAGTLVRASMHEVAAWPELLARASVEERTACARALVREALLNTIGRDPATEVHPQAEFFDLGLDSMRAAQLAGRIESELGRSVPETLVYSHRTVESLAEFVLREVYPRGR